MFKPSCIYWERKNDVNELIAVGVLYLSIDYIFPVKTRIPFIVYIFKFSLVFFFSKRSEKVVFRCGQEYVLEKHPCMHTLNFVNIVYIVVFDFQAAPENRTLG